MDHFVAPPQWEWYIVWYFFLGGIAGGVYALGAILRLLGDQRDAPIARLAFLLPYAIIGAFALLGVGFWLAYRDCSCARGLSTSFERPKPRRTLGS